MVTEYPLPASVTGAAPRAEGLPSQNPTELTPAQKAIADAIKERVMSRFKGVDLERPTSGGYNTYVDRVGQNVRATQFQDGFLAASHEKGPDFGDPQDVSYRLYRVLFHDPDGFQRGVLAFDDFKDGQRVSYIRYDNRDKHKEAELTEEKSEVDRAARELGIQGQPH